MVNKDKVLEEVADITGVETSCLEFSDELDKEKTVAVHVTVPGWSHLTLKDGGQLKGGNHTVKIEDIPCGIEDGMIYDMKADDVKIFYINKK